MTGYVKPAHGELRVREHETYRAAYCGICHALSRRYGIWARMLVNYDYVFLALLFGGDMPGRKKRRCAAHPFKRRCVSCSGSVDSAADATVLLAVWKLCDGVRDGGFLKKLFCRAALFFMRGSAKKAEAALPGAAAAAGEHMARLWEIEKAELPSIDAPADTFALLLSAFCEIAAEENLRRIARSLLYHLGRWVYIIDACDDLERDRREGLYNPAAARYGLSGGALTPEARLALESTLAFSRCAALDALALWPDNPAVPVLENILTLGLAAREREVFNKSGKTRKERSDEGSL